jgi:hypothetical protein
MRARKKPCFPRVSGSFGFRRRSGSFGFVQRFPDRPEFDARWEFYPISADVATAI